MSIVIAIIAVAVTLHILWFAVRAELRYLTGKKRARGGMITFQPNRKRNADRRTL